jgi:hypothetical protein
VPEVRGYVVPEVRGYVVPEVRGYVVPEVAVSYSPGAWRRPVWQIED